MPIAATHERAPSIELGRGDAAGDDLDEGRCRHRVEEVQAQEPGRPAQLTGQVVDRDRGRVRGEDRALGHDGLGASERVDLQRTVFGDSLDDEIARRERIDLDAGDQRALEFFDRARSGAALHRTGEILADAGGCGIRRRSVTLDHRDATAREEERVRDSGAHASAAEDSDVRGRAEPVGAHRRFLSRNSVMRRIFSGLSKSSACSSSSIAGCASAGASSAVLVWRVASGSFAAIRSAIA